MEIPPELFEKLSDARLEWSRHGYQLAARAMIHIDQALDELNDYLRMEQDYE